MTYEEFREEIKKLKASNKYPSLKSYTLPSLWIAEKNFSRIDPEIIRIIAQELELPLVEVEEAARFYAMFHTKEKGKYVIRVCTNLSCMLNGAEDIVSELKRLLGIEVGQTTPDGLFTLEEYECMGLCDGAPALTINEERFLRVKKEELPQILKKFGWKGE
ncbi:NADH dehydrogenase subunit E [Thermovibrio guaymasensis]|uniref:NADH dehydrogenase subunit E n=1 Tax=Thermovibrio guaymasensis TaxID=240167 RepID=A0A420W8P2_9BACT|nr:NAD(P)H-dependent oxidoreductase subunit E [Thermovibrio guaymasensis]RKQ63683.1 NADH dehydrogenase subunit E [Thermovibrio guaymasensis]